MKKILVIIFLLISIKGYCADIPDIPQLEKASGGFNIKTTVENITTGKFNFDVYEVVNSLWNKVFSALKYNFKSVSNLMLIALLSTIAENTANSFKVNNNTLFLVFFSLITVFGMKIFSQCMIETKSTIDNLLLFVNALFPVILNSFAVGGMISTAATLHPVLMICGSMVMMLIKSVILPLISVSAALRLSNAISADLQASKLADFLTKSIKWTVGIVMTLFVGVVSVSGAASGVYDSVTVRAAKYAVGSFIPVVGSVISDSFDLLLSGSNVIKNSVGIAGLINILFICVTPCIKILTVALSFNICAAVVQPVCNKRITDTISVFGELSFTLFGMLCASACMFILCTGVLISLR